MSQFLRHRARGHSMVAILDNAAYHYARVLDPFLTAHRKVLRLFFLPRYSPELNHIERLWKLTRRLCTHNRYFPQLEELVGAVADQPQKRSKKFGSRTRIRADAPYREVARRRTTM